MSKRAQERRYDTKYGTTKQEVVGSRASPSHDWWPTTHAIVTEFLNFPSTLSPSLYLSFAFQLSTPLIYNSQVWFVLTTQFLTPITLNGLYLLLLWSYLRQVLPIFDAHSSNPSSLKIFVLQISYFSVYQTLQNNIFSTHNL